MLIKNLVVGQIETNCYVVTDENTLSCAVIDPGDESNTILDYIEDNKLQCKCIFITHGHFDHTMAAGEVSKATGAAIYVNELDASEQNSQFQFKLTPETRFYKDGDVLPVGGLTFSVLETPGHSPGSVTLVCENAVFSGDAMFKDSCGRTDLPGGDMTTLLQSLKKICALEGDYELYPGHAESSTLDRERKFNYYVKYAHDN